MRKVYYCLCLLFCGLFSQVSAQEYPYTALDLETTIEIALENNLNLQRSRLNLSTAEITLLENRGQQIPSFSTGASSGFRWGRSINPVTNLFENRRIGNINLFANTSMPIYNGRQISNSIKQAKTDIQAAALDVEATENDIILNTINLFINVVFSKEQLNVANSQLQTVTEQSDRTKRLVEAGSLAMAEQLDLEAQLATSELEVVNADNSLRIAKLNLAQAMQVPFDPSLDVVVPDLDPSNYFLPEEQVDEIFAFALEIMPEIKSADFSMESADLGIDIAKGAFYPTLGISGNLFSNFVDQPDFLTGEIPPFFTQIDRNLSQTLNLQLNIPIFSNFRNVAGVQRARVQKQQALIQKEDVKNQLRNDIETAYTTALAQRQTYLSNQKRVSSLEEAFRMSQQRFDVGAINSVDFQVAQNNLFNAQADLVSAKYNYIFAVKVLDFYLGNNITL
ncbi:TolC family protein [Pararhodonellum marinum]|uniref:TolC family protein n=1 Tax=Pararhodonellum marinum TaxID=2755358 RepID=UPI00188E1971|nr:TolC family protein [Pararhodonellum marinum]